MIFSQYESNVKKISTRNNFGTILFILCLNHLIVFKPDKTILSYADDTAIVSVGSPGTNMYKCVDEVTD